jgi:hypothetical protein
MLEETGINRCQCSSKGILKEEARTFRNGDWALSHKAALMFLSER